MPRAWLFGSRSPPNGIGINTPCLPLSPAKLGSPWVSSRTPGAAAYNGAQTTDGARGGAGRGGPGRCAAGESGWGGGGDAQPLRQPQADLSIDCNPPAAGDPSPTQPANKSRILRAPRFTLPHPRLGHAPARLADPRAPGGWRRGQSLLCAGVHVHAWIHTHAHAQAHAGLCASECLQRSQVCDASA